MGFVYQCTLYLWLYAEWTVDMEEGRGVGLYSVRYMQSGLVDCGYGRAYGGIGYEQEEEEEDA